MSLDKLDQICLHFFLPLSYFSVTLSIPMLQALSLKLKLTMFYLLYLSMIVFNIFTITIHKRSCNATSLQAKSHIPSYMDVCHRTLVHRRERCQVYFACVFGSVYRGLSNEFLTVEGLLLIAEDSKRG